MKKILLLSILLIAGIGQQALSQDRKVSGKVTSFEDGSALPGVNVQIKGTTSGTATAADGQYSLSVPDGSTLVFSFIGLASQEVAVNSQTTISIQLHTDVRHLAEVTIVGSLGLERTTRSMSYAVTTVDADQLTTSKDRSVLNSLQGKVAGVQITSNSGSPGSSTSIVLRGPSSLSGNNQALFVVDGIPIDNTSNQSQSGLNTTDMGNRANDINPEDVQTVSVLKGPAAAALYGSRAANGAIIITTKSGKGAASRGKKAEITFNSSYIAETPLKLPKYQTTFGQGQRGSNLNYLDDQETWGAPYNGALYPWGQIIDNQRKLKIYQATPGTLRQFFEVGHQFNNTLSLAGGNANTNYYFSYANLDQKGTLPGSEYKRQSFKVAGGTKLANKFSGSGSVTYTKSSGRFSETGQGDVFYGQLLRITRDIPTEEIKDYKDPFNDLNGFFTPFNINPYYILGETKNSNNLDRIIGNVQLEYNPLDWLAVTYRIGTDFYSDRREFYFPISRSTRLPNTTNIAGNYTEQQRFNSEITSDLIVRFNKSVAKDFSINALVGYNVRQRSVKFLSAGLTELAVPGYASLRNQLSQPVTDGTNSQRRLLGAYGEVNLAYRDFLFLGFTGRNDWSSTLPEANRSFFYPSVNSSFVFSDFLGLEAVSLGKIRASYAEVGNDADPYQTQNLFVKDSGFPFQSLPGFTISNQIGNPALKPERTKAVELGLQVNFLSNRIGLDVTYYNQLSVDQIIDAHTSATTGATIAVRNVGSMRNKGLEIQLNATPVQTKNFQWDINANFTKNINRVESLYEEVQKIPVYGFSGGEGANNTVAQVGKPYGSWEVTVPKRDPNGNLIVDASTGRPQPADDLVILEKSIQPDFRAGFQNVFTYQGLSLSFLFDIRKGGYFYSNVKQAITINGAASATTYNNRQPWIVEGSVLENADGTFTPNTSVFVEDANQYWNNRIAVDNLVDASYIKLREVSLVYSLPKALLAKTPFGNISVGFTGRNLLIFTPKENIYGDPEVNSFGTGNAQGFDFGAIPSNRSYGGNIRLTF